MDHILNEVPRLCSTKHLSFWKGHIYGRQSTELSYWVNTDDTGIEGT